MTTEFKELNSKILELANGIYEYSKKSDSEKAYLEWVAAASNSCYTNIDMWNAAWEIAQAPLLAAIEQYEGILHFYEDKEFWE